MNENLKVGIDLLRLGQVKEAEHQLMQAAHNPLTREAALHRLVQIARKQKNFDLALARLDELLAISPGNLDVEVTRTHLRMRNGSLLSYRDAIAAIMDRLKAKPLPSVRAGKKLLRVIQYACTGSRRVLYLWELLESTRQAIKDGNKPANGFRIFQADVYFALGDYAELVDTVEQLSGLDPVPYALAPLQKVVEKCKSPNFPDFGAQKVFGIGLSRTATSSLNQALKIIGFHSIHWLNPHTQALICDKDFLLFDGFTDISVSYQFEKLYHTFPNARFIFTTRSIESWIRSITIHYQNTRSISSPRELWQPHIAQRFDGAAGLIEWNLYAQHPSWEAAFQHFSERISHFFADKPKDRFLEFRIIDGDGWEKLCNFLEKPVPDIPFPKTNQSPAHI